MSLTDQDKENLKNDLGFTDEQIIRLTPDLIRRKNINYALIKEYRLKQIKLSRGENYDPILLDNDSIKRLNDYIVDFFVEGYSGRQYPPPPPRLPPPSDQTGGLKSKKRTRRSKGIKSRKSRKSKKSRKNK